MNTVNWIHSPGMNTQLRYDETFPNAWLLTQVHSVQLSAWECTLTVESGTCWAWFGWVWHLPSLTVTISVTPTDSPQMSDKLIDWLHFYNRTSIVWLLKPPVQSIMKDPILTFMPGLCCLFNEPFNFVNEHTGRQKWNLKKTL